MDTGNEGRQGDRVQAAKAKRVVVALTSDTHGMLPAITDSDVRAVLHAGDIGPDRDPINWFRDKFYPWARDLGIPVYATFGNHDRIGQKLALPAGVPANLRFVVDEMVDVLDVPVWFSPWSSRYGDWAFMANDATLAIKYSNIHPSTQVLVTHGPPFGVGDLAGHGGRVGSPALWHRIQTGLPNLKLVVTGHIHEAFGEYTMQTDGDRTVRVLNVSYVNEFYEPEHRPVIISW